jgi:membrane protein DedA with SNARE-associated domain
VNTDQVGGIIRSILLAGAGYFVGKGLIDQSSATAIVGAIVTLASTGWSVWANRSAKLAEPKKIL